MNDNHGPDGRFTEGDGGGSSSKEHAEKSVEHSKEAKGHAEKALKAHSEGKHRTAKDHAEKAVHAHGQAKEHAAHAHNKAHGAGDAIHAHVAHEHAHEGESLMGKLVGMLEVPDQLEEMA